ncbi:MAG: siderophore-iron reductase FhuF [Methylorubrum populi]
MVTLPEIGPAGGARGLLADIEAALAGHLPGFRQGLAVADDPRPSLPRDLLLAPDMIARIAARFEARYGPTDPRAILSIWTSWHFGTVLPPVLAAGILFDLGPVLDFEAARFIMAPDLRTEAVTIGEGTVRLDRGNAFARFEPLVDAYLRPAIRFFASRGGLSERVLWSNAGTAFEALLCRMEALAGDRDGYRAARRFLDGPSLPDGAPNPLYRPVRYVEGRRIRRVCCVRFLVPDGQICAACPLDPTHPARRPHDTP